MDLTERKVRSWTLLLFSLFFRDRKFRAAAFGYFGHMWELYAFWAFVPIMLMNYNDTHSLNLNIPLLSFGIIAMGTIGCILAGFCSLKFGTQKVAFWALFSSFTCCLLSGYIFTIELSIMIVLFLFFWGFTVVADSPLFSTLVAQNASTEIKGTALTIVNCIGFAISIISIQLLNFLGQWTESTFIYSLLCIGPLLGLLSLYRS